MSAGRGLLTLLGRLVSGRLLHEVGSYARREVRLISVAVLGFVGFLTFLLGAAAIAVVWLFTVLAPRLGPLASYAVLIGVGLVISIACLMIAMQAAKGVTRWEGARTRAVALPTEAGRSLRDDDAAIALLISAMLKELLPSLRRARR